MSDGTIVRVGRIDADDDHPRARVLEHIVTFNAYYVDLKKARYGDYKLELGIPFEFKDLAWILSNHEGMQLEVAVSTLKRLRQTTRESLEYELNGDWTLG